MQNQTKNCQNCKLDFIIEPEDISFYEKMKVPAPTFCPTCRMIRRFNYRNEGHLFRRPDGHDGKEIFSGFSPEAPVVTYENSFWYSDNWDKATTGKEYDFSRPFFEQYKELLSVAPIPSRSMYNLVNSDYCNEASEMKNSYLCFNVDFVENSSYLRKIAHIKDSVDINDCTEDELCYEDVFVDKSYQTHFSLDCESCVDVWFSKGLRGCTNCFGCVNLSKKSYCYFNTQLTKEEYQQKISEHNLTSFKSISQLKQKARDFWLQFPVKYNHTSRTQNCTGERVYDSKNVVNSYSVRESENLKFCQDIQPSASNSYDYSVWGSGAENMYECMTCGLGANNLKFCFNCWENARDLEYCTYCFGSKNLFGCVGLYKKEYCIFNKQYTKEEYEALVPKIIEQMNQMPYKDTKDRIYRYGEFFPFEISPNAYNETIAQDFFPLTEAQAQEKGFVWRNPSAREYTTTIVAADLPDDIKDVEPSITKEIIQCASCKKAYRIILPELQFYQRIGLPLPRMCHMCRYHDRFQFVNPPLLWKGLCMCKNEHHASHIGSCQNEFETSYAPDRKEILYCESCYQQEVN